MNKESKFHEIKQLTQQLIHTHQHREVTATTNYKTSGIYMIYIDLFVDDKFVPIYIGQAKDIQKRYKDHYTELLALNRLSYEDYKHYFFSKSPSLYEGKFKTSKIFKYMVDNNCTLENFHMIILEEVDHGHLIHQEQQYFQQLLPSIFGFNQLNSFLKGLTLFHQPEPLSNEDIRVYCDDILKDIQHIQNYRNYGYTAFNFEHSLAKDVHIRGKEIKSLNHDTTLKVNETESALRDIWEDHLPLFKKMAKLEEKRKEKYEIYRKANEEFHQSVSQLKTAVDKKFSELKFYSLIAQENFINSILRADNPYYKKDFLKYVATKKNNIDFYKFYEQQIGEIKQKQAYKHRKDMAHEKVLDQYAAIRDERTAKRYQWIFPNKKYAPFVLKDRKTTYSFARSEDYRLENTCHIRFIVSHNSLAKSKFRKDPYIIRVDYQYIDEELKQNVQSYYIDSEITQKAQSGLKYLEMDFYDHFTIRKEPFKITSLNEDREMDNTFIAILAEYKHGVNDHTIKGQELVPLSRVLTQIEQQTNVETKFKIEATSSFSCLVDCMQTSMVHTDPFAQKIMNKKLPVMRKMSNKGKSNTKVQNKIPHKKATLSRADKYKQKIKERSNNRIAALTYISSKEKVLAKCNHCHFEWKRRSDHLLARPYCPKCR